MKNLVSILILGLLFLIACADANQKLTPSSSSYDGIWEGYAHTEEGRYYIKMEIKNGIMAGVIYGDVRDTKISGYIDSDNRLVTKPFYFRQVSTAVMVVGETDHMSPDRIEGTYMIQVAQASRYKWFVEKPGAGKSDITISQIKINEKEPWTGKFKVESSSQGSGVWAMKQEGQIVKSTKESDFEFKGKVQGNKLKGKIVGASRTYYLFTLEMASDNFSFTGTWNLLAHSTPQHLKGKRIE